MDDRPVLERINDLATEEENLWGRAGEGDGLTVEQKRRLDSIQVELDQCYDFLHQRQARRAVGLDPDDARVRPADIVERYQQ